MSDVIGVRRCFSIIIPVYNVEKYIEKCMQSLLGQTYHEFEALIIDDGSLDGSIEIAKQLVKDDPRFLFLAKENGGLSSARNFGLDHATGDYIAFLDSDDYWADDCLEKVMTVFQNHPQTEIVVFGFNMVNEFEALLDVSISNLDSYNKKDDILLTKEHTHYNVSDKIYVAEIWAERRFANGIIYEDKQLMPFVLYQRNIYLLHEYLYFYVQRSGSIMHSYKLEKSVQSMLYIYAEYKFFLVSNRLYEQYLDYYQEAYIRFCFYKHFYMILAFSDQYKEDCDYLIQSIDSNIVNLTNVKQYYGILSKQFVILALFKCSPVLTKMILQVKQKIFSFLKS